MSITKLDIVNACLKSMGETKLNTLEEDHTYKDDALDLIERVRLDVLSKAMWFNTEWLKLSPQADTDRILIPNDVLEVDTLSACGRYRIAQRGGRLYDTGNNKYEFTGTVTVKATRKIDFENMPYKAQAFIRDDAVLRFQSDFDGDNSKYQKIERHRMESWIALNSEHIRQIKANPLFSRMSVNVLRDRYHNFSGHPWHPHSTFPG